MKFCIELLACIVQLHGSFKSHAQISRIKSDSDFTRIHFDLFSDSLVLLGPNAQAITGRMKSSQAKICAVKTITMVKLGQATFFSLKPVMGLGGMGDGHSAVRIYDELLYSVHLWSSD